MNAAEELMARFTATVHKLTIERLEHEARKAKAEADLAELSLAHGRKVASDLRKDPLSS